VTDICVIVSILSCFFVGVFCCALSCFFSSSGFRFGKTGGSIGCYLPGESTDNVQQIHQHVSEVFWLLLNII